jgi:iron complex transport system ATP-binding protein
MTVLQTEGLGCRIAGRDILSQVSLRCESGQFVALLGANGAGKSTLLRLLGGLAAPQHGQVLLDGRPLAAIPRRALAHRRAYLPQGARAEWPVSVERLVALGLMPQLPVFGDLDPAAWQRVEAALAMCDLRAQARQPATTLSGGELARAMLARALVGEPDVLLADEPLAGLDPRHAIEVAARLADQARQGRLVIAALHDITLAARHATHAAILRAGRLIAFGPIAATLTAENLSTAFSAAACVHGTGRSAIVDFSLPGEGGVS